MSLPRFALAGLLVLSPLAAMAQDGGSQPPRREITVSGEGQASAAPDLATISFAVQRNAATAREALDQANESTAKVIAGMKELGIEPRDLQTSGFSISPQYRYDNANGNEQKPPELVGYEVRNGLTIRLRDLAKSGEILDRAVTLGVNSGGDIAFAVDNTDKLRVDAKTAAVKDATQTARALAEAAGVGLGDVVGIQTVEMGMPMVPMPAPMMRADAAALKSSVPVEAGETTMRANVTMTFAIVPKS